MKSLHLKPLEETAKEEISEEEIKRFLAHAEIIIAKLHTLHKINEAREMIGKQPIQKTKIFFLLNYYKYKK